MWLATKQGFFSIVRDRDTEEKFWVRGRSIEDVEKLHEFLLRPISIPVIITPDADYVARFEVNKAGLKTLMSEMADSVDYSNFKDMIMVHNDQSDKVLAYTDMWAIMLNYQISREDNYVSR